MPKPRALPVLLLALLALGCGPGGSDPAAATGEPKPAAPAAQEPADDPPAPAQPAAAAAAPAKPKPARNERPLPAFEGTTLDGQPFAVSSLLGRRALLFFFNPAAREAAPAAQAVARLARARNENNFAVVGVALAADADATRAFAAQHGLDFPIVDDASGAIANRLALRAPVAVIGTDAEGYVSFGLPAPPLDAPDPAGVLETQLREVLRVPSTQASLEPTLGSRPQAPTFTAERLEGGERFDLASLRGKPFVLVFFLYSCPHCHHALAFLRDELQKIPEASRPQVVGVSVAGSAEIVRSKLAEDQLDFFPVLVDLDNSLRSTYGVVAGVPEIFVVDARGEIVSHVQGWSDRDPPLMRMWLAKVAGQQVPMLLHSTGYSGSDVCAICHEKESDAWLLTSHARAFETLVKHGSDTDTECIGCHVVGWEKPGGYTISPPRPDLENVGCENCHGRGGPHLSPGFVTQGDYQPVCVTCHDPKHSLGFDYATFLPRVSHAAQAEFASLPLEKKRELLAQRAKPRRDLLPTRAAFVGSQACQPCHAQEYEVWAKGPHGRSGGFPNSGRPAGGAANASCESCHGPGGDHVGADAKRVGTIVSLGDKCDSCVILQICGSCHDDVNDPGFEFEVEQKIEAQKHGTIEPAATRGQPKSAALETGGRVGLVERGFALLDERG